MREASQSMRLAKWRPQSDVLVELIRRCQSAATKRMKPNMNSFDGAPMDRKCFRHVFQVELGISLSLRELEAIFEQFDRDQSGAVDYRECIHYLFSNLASSAMGRDAKAPPPFSVARR